MAEESEDKSQKTEQPTPHKIEKAKKDGQVTISKEVGHWFMLSTLALMMIYVLPSTFSRLANVLKFYFDHAAQISVTSGGMIDLMKQSLWSLGKILSLPITFLIVAALSSGLIQTKGVVSLKNLKPKLSKLSPLEGFKKLFGSKALVEFFKNMIKMVIIIVIAYFVMRPEFDQLHALPQLMPLDILLKISQIFLKLLIVVLSVLTVIAGLDYAYQKYKFLEDLKMSKKEIKDEYKEMEGDPHVKAKLRQLREEKARQRMIQDVPDATVIMMNPTHYAIALKYHMDSMDTPILIAKGQDAVAFKIKEIGEENDIPIVENPPLTRAIYANVKIGDEIPGQYFEAVARVIRYVFGYDKYYQSHLDDGIDEKSLEELASAKG